MLSVYSPPCSVSCYYTDCISHPALPINTVLSPAQGQKTFGWLLAASLWGCLCCLWWWLPVCILVGTFASVLGGGVNLLLGAKFHSIAILFIVYAVLYLQSITSPRSRASERQHRPRSKLCICFYLQLTRDRQVMTRQRCSVVQCLRTWCKLCQVGVSSQF